MIVDLIASAAIHHATHASRSHVRRPLKPAQPVAVAHDWSAVEVTAYCATGNRNASGNWPTVGTAAANAYPLGTRLDVEGVGVVSVEDRSAPGATDVDIYMGSGPKCSTAATDFGRRLLRVSVVR